MSIRSLFVKWSRPECPAYDYKTPAIILVMLVWYIPWYFSLPPEYSGDRYDMGVFILMLLFNYLDRLSHWFKWCPWLAVTLHVLSWGWIVFGLFYIAYWSRVLYPIPMPGGN